MASRSKGISVQLILTVVLGLIALAFAAGLLLSRGGGPTAVTTSSSSNDAPPMFPDLADQRDAVARIVITTDGEDNRRVELAQRDGGWQVASMADYPSVESRVATFLDTLVDAKRIEQADPEAVRSTIQEERRWRRVRLQTGDGATVLAADIGAQVSTPSASDLTATYVRPDDGDAVWLADLELSHPIAQPTDWLNRELLALPRERIAEVHTAPLEGTALHIRRVEGATGEFEAVDVDRELMADQAWKVGDLTVPFTGLRFLDARSVADEPANWPGYVTTRAGLELRFTVTKEGDAHWARFKLAATPDSVGDSDAEETEPTLDVEALRRAIDGRAFKLPDYTATRMTRGREALERETEDDGAGTAQGQTTGDAETQSDAPAENGEDMGGSSSGSGSGAANDSEP